MGRLSWNKMAHYAMKRAGVPEDEIPPTLRNKVIHRSRSGPLGQIVVKSMTGVSPSQAAAAVRKFEKIIGSKTELAEKLGAVSDSLTEGEKKLLELLQIKSAKALPYLFAEAGVEPTRVMSTYARACVYLGQVESAIEAQRGMPGIIRALVKLAVAKTGVCTSCGGLGKVTRTSSAKTQKLVCPECEGNGVTEYTSKHYEFATGKLLELSGLMPKQTGISVNTNVGVGVKVDNQGAPKAFFEKVVNTSDQILYSKKREEDPPIEAEVVQ